MKAGDYCTVYYYGKDEAINLGTIMSDGTAYEKYLSSYD